MRDERDRSMILAWLGGRLFQKSNIRLEDDARQLTLLGIESIALLWT